MTYRERRLARAERLRGWADKRQTDAARVLESRPELRHDWAFITQPGPIPERERMNRADDRAYSSLAKADSMARRADGIENAAAHAIYSDDPDAVEQLAAKIERLDAERARWRNYNAACRKSRAVVQLPRDPARSWESRVDVSAIAPEALAILTTTERREILDTARAVPYQIGKHGEAPSYLLSNLGGNISRLRERLARLSAAESVR